MLHRFRSSASARPIQRRAIDLNRTHDIAVLKMTTRYEVSLVLTRRRCVLQFADFHSTPPQLCFRSPF